jgi:hypothetical protein
MTLTVHTPCTAFSGHRRLAAGSLAEVALAVKAALEEKAAPGHRDNVLTFDDTTGRVIDIDTRGSRDDVLARLARAHATQDAASAHAPAAPGAASAHASAAGTAARAEGNTQGSHAAGHAAPDAIRNATRNAAGNGDADALSNAVGNAAAEAAPNGAPNVTANATANAAPNAAPNAAGNAAGIGNTVENAVGNAGAAENSASARPRGRGRPRLGVVAREVTLLPRHWEWLNAQPGGASVALRKLVEAGMRDRGAQERAMREAAYRFMSALAGDMPGFEEATRALFAGDAPGMAERMAPWPADIREHALRLAFGKEHR